MQTKDFFSEIALNFSAARNELLVANPPPQLEKVYFGNSSRTADPVPEKTASMDEFHRLLGELRRKYRPFMTDCSPRRIEAHRVKMLDEFYFRYETEADRKDFSNALCQRGDWEKARIPDYRGPIGRWTGYYRTAFRFDAAPGKRVFLRFLGCDYLCDVYVNGRHVGSHEGFFAPFEFDVTDFLRDAQENVLLVQVQNDIPTKGLDEDKFVNGDKIYAATGLGWDDPVLGWHHCPPGAGIWNKVLLEERPEMFVRSVFVRPDIDRAEAECWIEVYNTAAQNRDISLSLLTDPYNFVSNAECASRQDVACMQAGPGVSYYRLRLPMPDHRLWTCEEPWLYKATVFLEDKDGQALDARDSVFGMRKFHMDETGCEKGTLYLNNRPVNLRGANDMGHMQRCVLNEDWEQLIEDILIAKLANMNYFRFTQRPVQEEIYRFCDMLGMMNQTDLPLFGYLRRNQLYEAARQTGEMERLIRSHPSAVMVSYINEPFNVPGKNLSHRHMLRHEMELFFEIADRIVQFENPDRVVKHVEGDYDPPTGWGLSDFHCYCMWYTNHGMPIGKLYKGWLPNLAPGWKTGCGEYGAEGLDNYGVMKRFYPAAWLPETDDAEWYPNVISRAQTYAMHGDWYEEQRTLGDWIRQSQRHQAFATKLMTDSLRRRADKLVSTAIHLLIDAWPAGWMKTLVGVDRVPKPAYFAYRNALKPVRVSLRCDRWTAYEREEAEVESWVLNDTCERLENYTTVVTVRHGDRVISSYELPCGCEAAGARYAGSVKAAFPSLERDGDIHFDASLLDENGNRRDCERFTIRVFKRAAGETTKRIECIGAEAEDVIKRLGIENYDGSSHEDTPCTVVSDASLFAENQSGILNRVSAGGTLVLLGQTGDGSIWKIGDAELQIKALGFRNAGEAENEREGIYYCAFDRQSGYTGTFQDGDFAYWYSGAADCISPLASSFIVEKGCHARPLLYTYGKPDPHRAGRGGKTLRPLAVQLEYGKGNIFCLSLMLSGKVGLNPVLDWFLLRLMER